MTPPPGPPTGHPSERTETDLIRKAQEGSLACYSLLIRRYESRVFTFLLRRTGSRHDAEDLTQETLLRAWQRIGLYRHPHRFSTWLLTIAARLAASRYRRRKDVRPLGEAAHLPEARAERPDDRLERAERSGSVWAVAESLLTREQMLALWLRYAEDLPAGDIARVLGRSAVSVRVMLHRARLLLAEHLPDPHDREELCEPRDDAESPRQIAHENGSTHHRRSLVEI